jgi:hypothetical protein
VLFDVGVDERGNDHLFVVIHRLDRFKFELQLIMRASLVVVEKQSICTGIQLNGELSEDLEGRL